MAKLWTSFSVLLVVVMLLFLAPTLLLPGENVALGSSGNTTQEIEAGFNFTEDSGGGWQNFTAGGMWIDEPYGLCLEQYTREHVIRHTILGGCQFRNYTSGNGTVSPGDLNGTLWMQWHTVLFNQTYNLTPKYNVTLFNATKFGWMVGRGYFKDGSNPNDNFTFVFFIDFDSNSDMSTIAGKGFMESVNQSGRWANATGGQDVPDNMHKIIGDFDITKNGTTYTGNFHLRDYPPEEVFSRGWVNVTGMVNQEVTDPIHVGLDLVNFRADGPYPTNTLSNKTTDWEEINWGKDPIKTVNSSNSMGTGGKMDISRNTILYLEINTIDSWVRIQGTSGCNLVIDDTYGVTGDDGSAHGKLYELLALYIPDQQLPFTQFFNQGGFTFTPFGLPHLSTECYAGEETFADASIDIESVNANARQNSWDQSYGLYPHPQLASISPSSGYVGETLDVTIKGKYLLRADNYATNTGSVSFGTGITVNNYSFKNTSAIDNEIIARITIDPAASTGARTVNVTSCFGYAGGQGAGPYFSDELPSAFTIKALENSTVQGNVLFKARTNGTQKLDPFVVKLFQNGTNLGTVNWTGTTITNSTGVFIISNLTPGCYDIGIKSCTSLSKLKTNITLNSTANVDFGYTVEGDIYQPGDDWVYGNDLSKLCSAWNTVPGDAKWNPYADLNHNGWVYGEDLSLFCADWNLVGDADGHFE